MGYFFIMLNDIFTAAQGVYLRKKLDESKVGESIQIGRHPPFFLKRSWAEISPALLCDSACETLGWLAYPNPSL